MNFKFNVVVEKGTVGFYAQCLELDGVNCYGNTLEEVMKNIHQAAKVYLIMQNAEGHQKVKERKILTTTIEVKI